MANISIFDLQPAGSGFFSASESFIDSMQDLSDNELKMTLGGKGHGKSKSKNKSKNKSKAKSAKSGSCGCGYLC